MFVFIGKKIGKIGNYCQFSIGDAFDFEFIEFTLLYSLPFLLKCYFPYLLGTQP